MACTFPPRGQSIHHESSCNNLKKGEVCFTFLRERQLIYTIYNLIYYISVIKKIISIATSSIQVSISDIILRRRFCLCRNLFGFSSYIHLFNKNINCSLRLFSFLSTVYSFDLVQVSISLPDRLRLK